MKQLMLFIDGSVNLQSHIGYGAYLALSELSHSLASLQAQVKLRRFEHTSSTKLELQTLLWALSDIQDVGGRIMVYTDSQNIMGLKGRRDRFEQKEYRSNKNKPLNHYELYQEFYRITDPLNLEFVKISGHRVSQEKDEIDRLFTLVDRASRKAMKAGLGLDL